MKRQNEKTWGGTNEVKSLTPAPDPAAALQAANARADRYLAVLARWLLCTSPDGWKYCAECGAESHLSHAALRHAIGCVFAGLDAATVAALDADWTPG